MARRGKRAPELCGTPDRQQSEDGLCPALATVSVGLLVRGDDGAYYQHVRQATCPEHLEGTRARLDGLRTVGDLRSRTTRLAESPLGG